VVEESLKAFCVLFVFLRYPRQFDGVVDGIVYATLTGLGFELAENVFYHLDAFASGGLPRLEQVAFVRVVIFAAGHAMITTFTGVGVGLASLSRDRWKKFALVSTGLCLAISMHGLHNFLLGIQPRYPGLAIPLAVGLAWCGNCLWLLVVGFAIRAEARWIRGELAEEVKQGTLRPEDAVAAGGVIARIRRNVGVYPLRGHHTRWERALLWRLDGLAARLAVAKHRLREAPEDRELQGQVTEYRTRCRQLTRRLDADGRGGLHNAAPGEACEIQPAR
jgi:hypothetical protein